MDKRNAHAARILERSMAEAVDFERISVAVGLSLYRFHHLFSEQLGETPGAYLRRIRLDAAALRLRWTRESVGEIAYAVGYASRSSFNQAFARRFGMSPLSFRRDREQFPNDPTDSVSDKNVRLVESEGFLLLAGRYVGAPCFVPSYWEDFLSRLPDELRSQPYRLFVGLLYDDVRFTPPEQVRYDCCITVGAGFDLADLPETRLPLTVIKLEPGLCASMCYRGYYAASDAPGRSQSISHAYSYLLDTWVAQSRYMFSGDYAAEIYSVPHSRSAPQDMECTILVAVA